MWRTSLAAVLAIALFVCNPQSCWARDLIQSYEIESKAYQLCSSAESAMASGNWSEARALLLKAAALDPTSYTSSAHKDLALCYIALKQYDRAAVEAAKVTNASALYDIASKFYNAGQYDYGIQVMNRYMAGATDSGSRKMGADFIKNAGSYGYLQKGRAALDAERYTEAKRWLQKAASYDPSEYTAHIHADLAHVLRSLGEYGAAIEEGKKAFALDPTFSATAYTLALAYEDMLQFDQALIWMNRYVSMERDPGRQKSALQAASLLEKDRKDFNDPNNRNADYLDVMCSSDDDRLQWPSGKLPLKVAVANGTGVKGYKPTFNNLVKVAMDSWCDASGKKLDYKVVGNASDADIAVSWTKDPLHADLDHPGLRVLGLTQLNGSRSSGASDATVQISTVDPFDPNRNLPEGEVAAVVLHEMGHALGLGHSKLIKDTMYSRHAKVQTGLTKRDKATIARLYVSYPALGFVPKQAPSATPVVPVAPPVFLPPAAPDDSNVVPPMFVPPPMSDTDKLTPPMYTPPPPTQQTSPAIPIFLPAAPPAGKKNSPKPAAPKATPNKSPAKKPIDPVIPIFTPPPR